MVNRRFCGKKSGDKNHQNEPEIGKRRWDGCQFIEKGRTEKTERSEKSTYLLLNTTRKKMVDFFKKETIQRGSVEFTLSIWTPGVVIIIQNCTLVTAQPWEWDTPRVRKRVSADHSRSLWRSSSSRGKKQDTTACIWQGNSSPWVRVGTAFFCEILGSFTRQDNTVQPLCPRNGCIGVFRVSFQNPLSATKPSFDRNEVFVCSGKRFHFPNPSHHTAGTARMIPSRGSRAGPELWAENGNMAWYPH